MAEHDPNLELVDLIRARPERKTLFGCGIRLASEYVRGVLDAAGANGLVPDSEVPGLLKESDSRLTYRNEDMGYDPPMTTSSEIDNYCKAIGVETPPHTLMVFENIVTTSQEDRDGDVLHSDGAIMDPQMPLLWHHMLPAVVGKMLSVREQNHKHVRVASAIMESPLGLDCAKLIEFGALRISHGFRPLDFKPHDKGPRGSSAGYKISRFEVLEESVVSVPSNTGAIILAYSRGKLCTPAVKNWARRLYERRPVILPGWSPEEKEQQVDTITVPLQVQVSVKQMEVIPDVMETKHGDHDQSTHGNRDGGNEAASESQRNPFGTTPEAIEREYQASVAWEHRHHVSAAEASAISVALNSHPNDMDAAYAAVLQFGQENNLDIGRARRRDFFDRVAADHPWNPRSPTYIGNENKGIRNTKPSGPKSEQLILTEDQIKLGSDAAKQAAEGNNPPNWAVDEALWEKAKAAASKTYDEGDEAYWAVVVHIYQKMGGTIQGKGEKEPDAMQTKHGDHDQSTHGSWATGGGDSSAEKPKTAARNAWEADNNARQEAAAAFYGKPDSRPAVLSRIAHSLSGRANQESERAFSGKGTHAEAEREHLAAADSHKEAAEVNEQSGNERLARAHLIAADKHDEAAEAHRVAAKDSKQSERDSGSKEAGMIAVDQADKSVNSEDTEMNTKAAGKNGDLKCPECDYEGPPDKDGKCPECGAVMVGEDEEPEDTKAGRVLSQPNLERIQQAITVLSEVVAQATPPKEPFSPAPEPPKPEPPPEGKPPLVTQGQPQPTDVSEPDGTTLSLMAAAQGLTAKLFDATERDRKALLKLKDAIGQTINRLNRARTRSALGRFDSLLRR